MVIYDGIFVDVNKSGSLKTTISNQHVTFKFKGGMLENSVGKTVSIIVDGYGNNGDNEGYHVKDIITEDEEIKKRFNLIENPHITISIGKNGKPVNTRFIDFDKIDEFVISGKYGYFNGKEVVVVE